LRYVDMRSDPNAGGGIVGTNIRKQEQQEQGAAFALHIGPPIHEVRFLVTEADIDVPAIVSRFFGRGEPDRKCAEPIPGQPPTFTDKLVERAMQNGCVRGLAKWTLIELIEPNNGLSPGRRVSRIVSCGRPQDGASICGSLCRECRIHPNEAVANEARYLICAKRRIEFSFHDISQLGA